jgi:hypothetical protein
VEKLCCASLAQLSFKLALFFLAVSAPPVDCASGRPHPDVKALSLSFATRHVFDHYYSESTIQYSTSFFGSGSSCALFLEFVFFFPQRVRWCCYC